MARNVLYNEFDLSGEYLVKVSEASARILARRLWAWHVTHGHGNNPAVVGMTEDQMLEEYMLVNWAWFDEECT